MDKSVTASFAGYETMMTFTENDSTHIRTLINSGSPSHLPRLSLATCYLWSEDLCKYAPRSSTSLSNSSSRGLEQSMASAS
jgi:hypothetical protein